MIQLTDKLFAILVPVDAFSFQLKRSPLYPNDDYTEILYCRESANFLHTGLPTIEVSVDSISIVGTVDRFEGQIVFDFDCEEQIEHKQITSYDADGICYNRIYKDYLNPDGYEISCDQCDDEMESFVSLLKSKGVNPDNLVNEKLLIIEKL